MSNRRRAALIILGMFVSTGAAAIDVNVVGLFPNKAVVQINGGALQTLSVGQKTNDGVVLVSVDRDSATFDVQGRRMTLGMGHARMDTGPAVAPSVMVTANERGQFVTNGQINGIPIRFAVDTGAAVVALPASEARRVGIDYRSGQTVMMDTANGRAQAYRVKLDIVRVGEVTISGVDAVVMEGDGLPIALLGMSFLNRMDLKHEGGIMTLTKRY